MCGGWELLTEVKIEDRIKALKEIFEKTSGFDFTKSGQTIELIHTDDKYTNLKRGDVGIIELIRKHNDMENQIWVRWNNGSDLMLLEGRDQFVEVDQR